MRISERNDANDGPAPAIDRLALGFFFFFLGERIVGLAPLYIAAFLDQVTDLVGRHGQLALRTYI
jgi:hypothetical protein